jgi:glycosyltransferase involved in cell wall biosynthesis
VLPAGCPRVKVALYSRAYTPSTGGLERFGETLARWLVAQGHEVAVVTSTPGPSSDEGVRILRGGSLTEAAKAMRSADVVHVSGLSAKGIAWARVVGRRPIVTHHGYQAVCPTGLAWSPAGVCPAGPKPGPCHVCPARGLRGSFDVSFHRGAAERARTSVYVSRYLLERAGIPGTVVYNPVAAPSRLPTPSPPAGDTIAFAGRLVREKGLDVLLRALRSLPDVRLRVAGDGPLRGEWERLADHLGVRSRTTFIGELPADGVAELYAACAVVCVPSLWPEPFGYAAAEAMALGRPVVGLPTGALPELLADGRGFVAGSVAPDDLTAALLTALDDSDRRERAGAVALAYAARELTPEAVGARYLAIYERVGELR